MDTINRDNMALYLLLTHTNHIRMVVWGLDMVTKTIFRESKLANPGCWESKDFKALFGWVCRFINRKNIKFLKHRCGKEKTAQEYVTDFEDFMEKLRFDFLLPKWDDGSMFHYHLL